MNEHVINLTKEFEKFRYHYEMHRVFEDFLELAACTISNRVNSLRYEEREARYMEIIKKYEKEDANRFAKILAILFVAMDEKPNDYLGLLFMHMELFDTWKGQFFTPYEVAKLMSDLTIKFDLKAKLEQGERIRLNDCAVGGGVTLIAAFNTIKELGYNPQQVATFYAQDVDRKAVFMSYIQLSILGVNAQVFHMDTLTLQHWETWLSPGYFMGHGRTGNKQEPDVNLEELTQRQLTLF